jgi:hypothetical protein
VIVTVDPAATSLCQLSVLLNMPFAVYTIDFLAPGTCVIDANQAGNAEFLDAPLTKVSVSAGRDAQSIVFTSNPGPALVGGVPYKVTAVGGGSGNPVTFSAPTPSVCTVTGSSASFVGDGTCTIDANQAGNGAFTAAPTVTQSFSVFRVLTFTSPNTAAFTRGVAGSVTVTATGAPSPTFTASGPLDGLTFSNGVLSGTPTAIGTFPITFTVSDTAGSTASQAFTLTVGSLRVTTSSLPGDTRGIPYSFQLSALGGIAPLKWRRTAALPRGLKLSSSGLIFGTPKTRLATGSYPISVQVIDATRRVHEVATATLTLTLT